MKITINQLENFKKHKNKIGIILFVSDTHSYFYETNDDYILVKNTDLQSLTNNFIEEKLLEDDELRDMAEYHDIINVSYFDEVSYISYINNFN